MLAFPSAVKTRAATPGVPRIPSPTAATIATGRSTAIFSTSWRCSSALNIRSSALFKRAVGRRERVEDTDGDPGLDRGENGARVDDLGTEVTQLRGFGVGHGLEWLCALHDTRVSAHNSAYVGVDPKVVGLRGCGEHGRRI